MKTHDSKVIINNETFVNIYDLPFYKQNYKKKNNINDLKVFRQFFQEKSHYNNLDNLLALQGKKQQLTENELNTDLLKLNLFDQENESKVIESFQQPINEPNIQQQEQIINQKSKGITKRRHNQRIKYSLRQKQMTHDSELMQKQEQFEEDNAQSQKYRVLRNKK
eukprot:TRINITY_DN12072_c0_g1_i4.p2 TRINITY_DN12072_c0_g1~~TRINITY_DN12072_c0_g1_i4.p2  ORF type:complete len:165 (-),score=27.03 TRINITY_DN12072_c0_g1_i4:224-718(-)